MPHNPYDPPVRRTSSGYGASGPRFHVWEEDRRELIARATELMRDSVQPLAEAQNGQRHHDGGEERQRPHVPRHVCQLRSPQ